MGLEHPALFNNLAGLFVRAKRMPEAERCLRRALALRPAYAEAHTNLGLVLVNALRVSEGLVHLRRAVELAPALEEGWHNLLLQAHYDADLDRDALAQLHRRYGARRPPVARPAIADPAPERVLRVGLLSSDLRQHSVAHFAEPFLRHADRARLQLSVYSTAVREDQVTARLRGQLAVGEAWHAVADLDTEALAARIAGDAVDVLIELNGHTQGSRLPVLARRPAPLQATWIGYPNTTGLSEIDLRFTDAIADPPAPASAPWHAEQLARLAGGFLAYQPPPEAPEPVWPAARADGRVTFGSFNALPKIGPRSLALWGRVLAAVPNSVLFLKAFGLADPATRALATAALTAAGLPIERVALVGPAPTTAAHLAAYQAVHVALDTFPYGGTTTTCEALWMGLPVVTRVGEAHVSRVGASLLARVGLSELAAESDDAYVAAAVALARDPERLSQLRRGLRERLRSSELFDGARLAREVEGVLRRAWRALVAT